jgi:two-component system phosphate regulon response regulator PhoB
VRVAGLRLDPGTHRVTAGARQLVLGRVEFRLLNFLMHHPERVHSRAQLLDRVWGRDVFLDERTVDAHVGRLRSALQASGHQDHIETVRGSGYRFVAWDGQRTSA